MNRNKKNFKKGNRYNKFNFNQKNNKYPYFYKKNKKFLDRNNIYYILGEKKPSKPLMAEHLYRIKKKRTGIFFKKPSFKKISYPFHLNLKLIDEYLKKK
uniref:Uncharacterized protein n=1 Tax=Bremia lactucae TaxID=4779 RepID=A0A3Q8U9M1_BRELC|nr:hypothetical protein [Bremia lactucae]AZL92973.1 hypothetical protein [Bremia lactucae]